MLRSLDVGAYGWAPSDWQENYYPDDLPDDWQFSYYANEFRHILIPRSELPASTQEFFCWQEEVGEGFSFYLEVDDDWLEGDVWAELQDSGKVLNCWLEIGDPDTSPSEVSKLVVGVVPLCPP